MKMSLVSTNISEKKIRIPKRCTILIGSSTKYKTDMEQQRRENAEKKNDVKRSKEEEKPHQKEKRSIKI